MSTSTYNSFAPFVFIGQTKPLKYESMKFRFVSEDGKIEHEIKKAVYNKLIEKFPEWQFANLDISIEIRKPTE